MPAIAEIALAPSIIACLPSSPGINNLTADCISLAVSVCYLLYLTKLEASIAILSNKSFINEFIIFMLVLDIPVSLWTCFNTL